MGRAARRVACLLDVGRGEPLPERAIGPVSDALDTTDVIWAFFRDRRR